MATSRPSEALGLEEINPETKSAQYQQWLERNVYFDDKQRKIDFILVYSASSDSDSARYRSVFESNLINMGLEYELQDKELSPNKNTFYLKIHAPESTLRKYAEYMGIRLPIERQEITTNSIFDKLYHCLKIDKIFSAFQPKITKQFEVEDCYTSTYLHTKQDKFFPKSYVPPTESQALRGEELKRELFSDSTRSMIVYYILSIIPFSIKEDTMNVGLERLMSRGGYSSAYPIHDGPCFMDQGQKAPDCYRQFLYKEWGSPFAFYKSQPLDNIREYFGDKIAIYFAFIGLYTRWLFYASVFGVIVFIFGLLTIFIPYLNPVKFEVCAADPVEFYMCPLCENRCDFWFLRSSCTSAWFSKLFDNTGTILFSVFTSLWAILFIEAWKRNISTLKYDWDLTEFKDEEEHPRPEYENRLRTRYERCNFLWYKNAIQKVNPVTQQDEFFQPTGELFAKVAGSFATLLTLVLFAMALVIGVIAYKVIVKSLLTVAIGRAANRNNIPVSPSIGSFIVTLSAAVINLLFIGVMQVVYKFLATWLTNWELHRTESDHEDSFTLKMFIFQCINYYSSIFYVAFIKGKVLVEYPGSDSGTLFLLEECETYGCFLDLCIQLSVIFLGKQLFNNILEIGLPLLRIIMKWLRRHVTSRRNKSVELQALDDYHARWEREELLDVGRSHYLFYEYLELIVQFGFVTLFVAAFPLAPLFAFLNNIVEIRLDAYKFLVLTRRYVGFRAADIGIWLNFLDVLAKISILSNAFLITFTGTTLDQYVYSISRPNNNSRLDGFTNFSLSTIPCTALPNTLHFPTPDFQTVTCLTAENAGVQGASNGQSCFNVSYNEDPLYQPYYSQSLECCSNSAMGGCVTWTNVSPNIALNQTCCQAMQQNTSINPIPESSVVEYNQPATASDSTCNVKRQDIQCTCRYYGRYSPDPYKQENQYYYLLVMWKLAFILVFENLIFLVTGILAWLIPDVPHSIRVQIKREQLLANKILYEL